MKKIPAENVLKLISDGGWKEYLFPLCFTFSGLLNFAFYYIGLAYRENPVRTYGYILGQIVFAIICGLTALFALKNAKMKKASWFCLGIILLFYGASFALGFIKAGFQVNLMDYLARFITLVLPGFFAGIYSGLSHGEKTFLSLMEKISFFAVPAGVIYFNLVIFNCNPFRDFRYFGVMTYAAFANTIMPFLLVHIIQFVEQEDLKIPFLSVQLQHPQVIRGFLIAIYWIAIIGSGTRGIYVCIAGFCVFLVSSKWLHREPAKRAVLVSCAMILVLLFNIFIYAPSGMKYGVKRFNEFLDGLSKGKILTSSNEDPHVQDIIDDLVDMDGKHQVSNYDPEPPASPSPSVPANEDPVEPPKDGIEEIPKINNRGTLYKLAWKEFLKSPWIGMGAGQFEAKYGIYPHNIVLQLLCETGLAGSIPMLLLILAAIFKLLRAGRENREIRCFLIFLTAYMIKANYSDNAFMQCGYLLCALGYAYSLQISCLSSQAAQSNVRR